MSPLVLWALIWGGALALFVLITALDQTLWRIQLHLARKRREALMVHQLRKEMRKGALL